MKLLSFHKIKPTDEKLKSMSKSEQKIYAKLLQVGLLNSEIPNSGFEEKDAVENKYMAIEAASVGQLLEYITKMRNTIK